MPARPGPAERALQISFYETYLRATTNRNNAPYAERTVRNYVDGVRTLHAWLAGVEAGPAVGPGWSGGGFERLDAATVNAFFRDYHARNSQGGTNTLQRNLATFFHWLAEEFEVPDLYAGKVVNRYGPGQVKSPVLDNRLITDLLKVTAGKDYANVRDHAIIRLFLTGMRLEQMTRLQVGDLDLARRVVNVAGLKGGGGHPMPFGQKAALACNRWLRVRLSNTNPVVGAESGPLWLGTRNRAAMTTSGIYRVVRTRAVQAGHDKSAVYPHMFRHTFAHVHLEDGGSETDLMKLMDWNSRSMLNRYGASLAQQRALSDAHERNLDDRY